MALKWCLGTLGRSGTHFEMQLSMSSDDVQRAVATITARASALGGGIASSNVDYGDPNAPPDKVVGSPGFEIAANRMAEYLTTNCPSDVAPPGGQDADGG